MTESTVIGIFIVLSILFAISLVYCYIIYSKLKDTYSFWDIVYIGYGNIPYIFVILNFISSLIIAMVLLIKAGMFIGNYFNF